jgi:hypothetical protein
MLGKVLRAHSHQPNFLDILVPIATYPWFAAEFISAGGLEILALGRPSNELNTPIEIVTDILLSTTSYDTIRSCVSCTRTMLMTEGDKSKEPGSHELVPTGETYRSLDRMAGLLVSILDKWENDRRGLNSNRARGLMPTNGEDEGGLLRCDANSWSSDQWDILREDIKETILGLRRRYIMPAASVERQRFVRDPDGICSLL